LGTAVALGFAYAAIAVTARRSFGRGVAVQSRSARGARPRTRPPFPEAQYLVVSIDF